MDLRPLLESKRELERRLLAKKPTGIAAYKKAVDAGWLLGGENILGTAVGWKYKGGKPTDTLCIVVYVVSKRPDYELTTPVPSEWRGHITDVQELGEVIPFRTGRYRPAPGGVSIGHYQVTAGTLGSVLSFNSRALILSNNHVLANSNGATIGDPVLQPGPHDGGLNPGDMLATLEHFVPIRFGGLNTVDAALAQPIDPNDVSPDILGIGIPTGIAGPPSLGDEVLKSGRSTGVTQGVIEDIDVTIDVDYGNNLVARFTDQLRITGMGRRFSEPGDSGSAIIDGERKICALLFAGSRAQNATFANPIDLVLDALG